MTMVQWTVRLFGWLFGFVAILGFSASGGSFQADPGLAPRLLGVFPVNVVHNSVHLAFAAWALVAYHNPRWARSYATISGVAYLLLAGLGVLTPDLFGLAPIGGSDIWLHLGIGIVLAGVGFAAPGGSAAASSPRVETRAEGPAGTTTASSPEATVTRPPAQPSGGERHDKPVSPKPAQNEGAAPASPPPALPEHVVDEPPRQPERREDPPSPGPSRGGGG